MKREEEEELLFRKLPIKKLKTDLNEWESSLIEENIKVNRPPDLAKLLFVLTNDINADRPQQTSDSDLKESALKAVRDTFDDSGETATETCFEMALEYGFIRIETDPNTKNKRYAISPVRELDSSHDWFCFDCDVMISKKSRQFLKCDQCFRVFHRKCAQKFNESKDVKCRYCDALEEFESGYINTTQTIDPKRMNRVIGFLLDFVKSKVKKDFEDIDIHFETHDIEYIHVFKKMSLSLMREKVDREEYRSISEFDDDFFQFMHNLLITQIHFETIEILNKFAILRTLLLKELNELKKCVDCYERANDKTLRQTNKEWFCLPCDPPHTPKFVKQRNNPYWPAKIIKILDNKKIEVCFFEAEKVRDKSKGAKSPPIFWKSEVKSSDVRNINDSVVLHLIKTNHRLTKPLELLVKYLELFPDNRPYIKTIELIKQNISELKSPNTKSMEESIESVIKNSLKTSEPPSEPLSEHPSKSRQRNQKSKATPKMRAQSQQSPQPPQPQPTPKQMARKLSTMKKALTPQSSNSSTRSSSPISIPILSEMVGQDMNDSLSSKVDDMNILEEAEPPTLDMFNETPNRGKRRSGRIAALITPQKTDPKKKIDSKFTVESKRKVQNKSIDEIPMEVEVEDNHQTNESLLESGRMDSEVEVSQSSHSVPSNSALDLSKGNSSTKEKKSEKSQSLVTNDSNTTTQTKASNSSQSLKTIDSINVKPYSQQISSINLSNVTTTDILMTETLTSTPMTTTITPSITSQSNTTSSTASIPMVPLLVETASISSPVMASPSTARLRSAPSATQSRPPSSTTPLMATHSPTILSSSAAPTASTSFEGTANKENNNNNLNQTKQGSTQGSDSLPDNTMVDRLSQKFKELNQMMEMEGQSIPKIDLNEKIILMEYYFKGIVGQMDSLKVEVKDQKNYIQNIKSERWCCICQKPAKHYCCVRYYCSRECQITDWKTGHHLQCLDLNK